MEQLSGFINPAHSNHVCKLHRSIYGLKQVLRTWFSRLSSYLVTMGFVGSKSDTSLFLRRVRTDLLLVLIYVDDVIITGNDSRAITRLIQELGREFSLKDLGPLYYFLGGSVIVHPQVYFSLNRSTPVTCFSDSRWMVSSRQLAYGHFL